MRVSTSRLVMLFTALGCALPLAGAADCNQNGTPDDEEIRSGAAPDCNGTGVPDSCDILPINFGLASTGSFFVGQAPLDVAASDLDGDGDVDLATADSGSADVTVLWNSGRGSFASPQREFAATTPSSLALGDFDGDGLRDIAVGSSEGMVVLFQNPQRRFLPRATPLALDPRIQSMTSADLDQDGDVDLAAAVSFGVRVLRNEGNGTFTVLDLLPIGSDPVRIVAARLDGDGDIDLATSNGPSGPVPAGNVSVLINRGDSTFETARNYATGPNPGSMIAADLDGDGDADLATGNAGGREITVLLGDGAGRFTRSLELVARQFIFGMTTGDFEGDGDVDLVSAGLQAESQAGVSVFLNNGRAEFARPVVFEIGTHPIALAAADVNGDQSMDIVVGDVQVSVISVIHRTPVIYSTDCNANGRPDDCELDGNDCNANGFPDGCDVASLVSADCDQDGMPDECQPDCNQNRIADACDIASGAAADCNRNGAPDDCDVRGGAFGFEASFLPLPTFTSMLSSSDLDGDGRTDLFGMGEPGDLLIFWNAGPEGFLPETRFALGHKVTDIAAGDFDGDGDGDIVLASASLPGLQIVENKGNRSFVPGPQQIVPAVVNTVTAVDLDGDRDLDLAATTFESSVVLFVNQGGGTFRSPIRVGPGVNPAVLEAADLDGDGRMDLAAGSIMQQDSLLLLWNDGLLGFQETTRLESRIPINSVALSDTDSDGDTDIFISLDRVVLFRNEGGRAFTFEGLPSTQNAGGILAADLDLDGDEDLAAIFLNFQLAALLNQGGGVFDPPVGIFGVFGMFNLPALGDWNGDGAIDVAIVQMFFCADCPIPILPPPPEDMAQLAILENLTRPPASKDTDSNGIPDECQPRPFHRGDADGDGRLDLTDPVFTLRHLFQGDMAPPCAEAADSNNDARLEITDPIATLDFLFRGGAPPAPPGPPPGPCGLDTDAPGSSGDIGCGSYEGCAGA